MYTFLSVCVSVCLCVLLLFSFSHFHVSCLKMGNLWDDGHEAGTGNRITSNGYFEGANIAGNSLAEHLAHACAPFKFSELAH